MFTKLSKILYQKIKLQIRRFLAAIFSWFKLALKNFIRVIFKAIFEYRLKAVRVVSVKAWCQRYNLPLAMLDPAPKTFVQKPNIFGIQGCQNCDLQFDYGEVDLPPVYLTKIPEATVIGGTELIITKKNELLYDELALWEEGRYGIKTTFLYFPTRERAIIPYLNKRRKFESAIHFCKDHSFNYFHWLVECLPRLSIVNQFPEYDSLPLLLDSTLQPQQIEALSLLNTQKRELIQLERGVAYQIENLIYPSSLSVIHDNYHSPVSYRDDILISPVAINYLRENFIKLKSNKSKKPFRKIYISRKKSASSRALLNTEELESLFIDKGFEIVYPEFLSFANQVKIFSEAEIVVGATGAAMTNLIFMSPGTKAIVLYYLHPQVNYYLFSQIANILNINLQYVLGNEVEPSPYRIHSSFTVGKAKVERAVDELLNSEQGSEKLMRINSCDFSLS